MSDYKRPQEGFRFQNGGMKTNATPDSLAANKYPYLLNVRSTSDGSLRTRPGVSQTFTTGAAVTDLHTYAALATDNKPRILARLATDNIYLDTGALVGSMASLPGGGRALGAAMVPFRPNQSPTPYMYIATASDYQKFSAPDGSNNVVQQNVGIAEPQQPPNMGITGQQQAFVALPVPGTYTVGGTGSGLTIANRLNDTVSGVFPDPNFLGAVSLAVAGGSGLTPGIYLTGSVLIYLWPRLSYEQGAYGRYFPLSTATAAATAVGNSLLFNDPTYNGNTDPNVQPMQWATINASGGVTGHNPLPTAGGTVGSQLYDMVVLCNLFFPSPGTYTLNINHDDGMFFAIQGATLVSGPHSDPSFLHTQTSVNGYSFSGGGVAGTNQSGNRNETFQVSVTAPGTYAMEINYSQWVNAQQLCVLNNGANIFGASGIGAYQKGMAVLIAGAPTIVQDVFAPLPQAIPILGLYYLSGTTGNCVVVPSRLGSGPGVDETSLYAESWVSSLRRGALVQIGNETCIVYSVSSGPDGTISFESRTLFAHTTADSLQGVSAISVFGNAIASGSAITSPDAQFTAATGIGTLTSQISLNPFSLIGAQPDDYVHASLNVDNLANLNEIKILFDVGDGSFTQNFYFKSIRPNDIALGVSNGLTQLGVAQLVAQRAVIDEEQTAESANQGPTSSSAQSATGAAQWSEILFGINELTRVGNDQSKTLQNTNAVQILVNCSAGVNVACNSITVTGGSSPDVGQSGAPYLYRVRPRSSVTGAKGNPSPATRYGVNPRRQPVTVQLPYASYDQQIDTLDVYRYGGTITSWRRIGSVPILTATFADNYSDASANAGELLEFDNHQPWPSIDVPLNVTATSVTGTTALVVIPAPTNALRFLPGNLVRLAGGNVYTLWTRPTLISGTTYLFQFLENAGARGSTALSIYEPAIAQQRLPYLWGPDTDGTMFGCGDPLRPGTLSFTKNNQPDSAPDANNVEIVPPSEPLLGGELLDGTPYVGSTERWWRLYFQPDNPTQRYAFRQQPIPRGLAAPYGHCTDGAAIYFWAKDGIWSTSQGSLTDEDLYNLFPHEGVPGKTVTYFGTVVTPPDYSRAGTFRLETANGYLYATYQDSSGVPRCLTLDIKRMAWCVDNYQLNAVTVIHHPDQQEGTVLSNTALYPTLLLGTATGLVGQQADNTNDFGVGIVGQVATREWDGGDTRAGEQWGDMWIDLVPTSPGGVVVAPTSFGAAAAPQTIVPSQTTRLQTPISVGGELLADFLGVFISWLDNFSSQSSPTVLNIWQPSWIQKPETIQDRITDWYSMGEGDTGGPASWWQGFILHADTLNVVKGIVIRDADTGLTHPYSPVIQHNGEQSKAYSFNTPFIAHLVRIEPTDLQPWRFFDVEWIAQPTPESAETWQTQGMSFGFNGYSHIQRIVGAYAATTPVTLTITSFDGQSPAPVVLPATGGAFQKLLQVLTANKGQLYFFKASSSAPFQLYLPDFEIMVGNWGREGPYLNYKSLGGAKGDKAEV